MKPLTFDEYNKLCDNLHRSGTHPIALTLFTEVTEYLNPTLRKERKKWEARNRPGKSRSSR